MEYKSNILENLRPDYIQLGTALYLDKLTNNVSIGEVQGLTFTNRFMVKSTDSTANQIVLQHSGNGVAIAGIGQESSHGSLQLRLNSGATQVRLSAINSNYIMPSLGIGVTSLSAKLQVDKDNANSSVVISRSGSNIPASTGVGSITFASHYNSAYTDYAGINAYSNNLSPVRGSLDLKVKSTSGTLLTGMTLYGTSSGINVGIGTASPGAKLDVVGAIKVGNSGTSIFTDTSAFPLQLNRGLDVDVFGANGASLGIGSLKGTVYHDAARLSGALAVNGTDGNMTIQTLGSGSYSTGLTINSAQALKFNAYDSTNNTGTPTYILGTDASGNVVKVLGGDIPGVPGGSGTLNTIPLWTPDGDTLGDSPITISGNDIISSGRGVIENTTNLTTGVADGLLIKNLSSGTPITNGFGTAIGFYLENTVYSAINEVAKISVIQTDVINIDNKMVFSVKDNNILADRLTLTGQEAVFTGNVGIGTTGAKAKLEVAASVNGNPVTSGSSQTSGALRVRGSATNVLDIGQQSASPYAMWMQVCESTSLGVSYPLVINPNGGNVGIGTDSPGYKLDVTGDARFGDGNNFNPLIQYAGSGRAAGSPGYSFVGDLDTGMFNPNLGNTLAFSTGGSEYMRIASTGRIGINTTVYPSSGFAQLMVNGAIASRPNGVNDYFSYIKSNWANDDAFELGIEGAGSQHKLITSSNYYYGTGLNLWTSDTKRLIINSAGAIQFAAYDSTNNTGTPTYLLGTDASGNIVKTNTGNTPTGSNIYTMPSTAGGSAWKLLGRFTANNGGQSVFIKMVTNSGYNASIDQNTEVYIRFKTSNGSSVDANGFSGDSSFYTIGAYSGYPGGDIKWVSNAAGTAATSYELYINMPQYSGNGGFYSVENTVGTWTPLNNAATDPGAASSTILLPTKQFKVGGSDLVVGAGGANSYFANSNVGIGITGPSGRLHVADNDGPTSLYITNTDTAQTVAGDVQNAIIMKGLYWSGSATSQLIETRINSVHQLADGNGGSALTFMTQTGGSGVVEQVRIDRDGNVGIGTTTPRPVGSGYKALEIGSPSSGSSLWLSGFSDTTKGYLAMDTGGLNLTAISNHSLTFGTNNSTKMTILSGGDVGVGNTLPQHKLDVSGTIRSQNYRLAGNTTNPTTTAATIYDQASVGLTLSAHNISFRNYNGTAMVESARLTYDKLTVVGDVIAYGTPSDKRLKENVKPIDSALDKAMKLQGVTFDWKESDSILNIKEDIGFIAQDVQKVVPELVRENKDGMLSMRHQGIAPILLEAIKELKAEIDLLKSKPCTCNKCNCNI